MADQTVTLRPNGVVSAAIWTASGGAPAMDVAWADDDDTTYYYPSSIPAEALLDLDDPSLPALTLVRSIVVRLRASTAPFGSGGAQFTASVVTAAGEENAGWTPALDGTIRTYTIGAVTSIDGSALNPADLDGTQLRVQSAGSAGQGAYEVYVDVVFNEAPSATPTGPTGTYSTNSRPPIAWTYADPEGDRQERYQAKVFSAAQYGAGGFDPETSSATWGSGEVVSAATTVTPPVLPNDTYRAYVKVADAGSGGRYGAWSFIGFVVAVPAPPAAPTLTATADEPNGRVVLDLLDTNSSLDPSLAYKATIERSSDGGTTWAQVRVAIGTDPPSFDPVPITAAGQHYTALYDYEAPYHALLYRAVEEADDTSGGSIGGAYSSSAACTFQPDVVWLKDPVLPDRNMVVDIQLPFTYSRKMRTTATPVLASQFPIARSDGLKGDAGKMSIDTIGNTETSDLSTLLRYGHTLLLQLPAGERQRYLTVVSDIDTVAASLNDSTSGFRTSTFDWVEVAAP